MGTTSDDGVKQKILDLLAEEPLMVISTAYAYAKNYVLYGEDITKAWTTAVEQASIIAQIKTKVQAEIYDSFKKDYENCLKADKVAMLEELKKEIEELQGKYSPYYDEASQHTVEIIQEKINSLKENENGASNY